MTETNASGGGKQGQSGLTKPDNFVEKLFGPYAAGAWIGHSGDFDGNQYDRTHHKLLPPDQAHYVSSAIFKPKSGSRSIANFAAGILVVLDDVMVATMHGSTKQIPKSALDDDLLLSSASWIIETSHGNYQYGYRIKPETDFFRWHYFHEMLKLHPVFGASARQSDTVHYYRLPTGINPKKGGFKTRLHQDYDGSEWELDDLAMAMGIDMSDAAVAAWKAQRPRLSATEYASPDVLAEIMGLIPNDAWFDDRNRWVAIGCALKNASNDDPETRDLWIGWDRPDKGDDAERTWDTARDPKAGLSTLRREIERRYGIDSPERAKVAQLMATDPNTFADDLPDEFTGMPKPAAQAETAKTEAKLKFDELLKEARGLTKIPAAFANETDDANWLDKGSFVDAFATASTTQPGSPTVFAPFDRGVVSTRTGAPFSGKSLLLLDQMAAFCADRADLIGSPTMFGGDVLYFCNEDSHSTAVRRLQAWQKRHGVTGAKHKLIIVRSGLLRKKGEEVIFECVRVLEAAVAHLKGGGSLPMIVVDTLPSSLLGIEENSTKEMGEAIQLLKRIAWAFWSAVVFVHHGTKVNWNGKEPDLASALRGSGSLVGAVRGADIVRGIEGAELVEKGWAGRKVVGCRVIKASDDGMMRERYYEVVVESIEVLHAETGAVTQKGMPVMVPIVPVPVTVFADEAEKEDRLNDLWDAIGKGPVWRYKKTPRKGPDAGITVSDLWGVDTNVASEIVDALVAEGVIEIKRETASKNSEQDRIRPKQAPVVN